MQPGDNRGIVAVMQPYFFPYGGYYRLLAAAQTFVVFDDVQFVRRGRIHRCEIPGPSGAIEWLTLPLARQPRDTRVCDLTFAPGARRTFDERVARLTWLRDARGPFAHYVRAFLARPLDDPTAFLVASLTLVARTLELPARIVRASELSLDANVARDRNDRILALVRAAGGTAYLNAPGGRRLYDATAFAERGVALRFLDPYRGSVGSMLHALATEDAERIRADIFTDLTARP